MVPSDFSWLPKTPIPSSQIPAKSHQSPQLMLVKWCRLTPQRRIFLCSAIRASNASAAAESSSSSLRVYSAKQFELIVPNIDLVLEDVGPYLINDGGNVDVVSVEDGVVSLKLQGACGSCPSSTTTMKMGIEGVLKEKFGDALKDIQQVFDEENRETIVEVRAFDFSTCLYSVDGFS
ncbi:nifU-like protein 1, chloroplastic [Rosa chinensis]|uniref:nifU-like protein 1, chloroplastic n=1 Tax=Rosa chinensis TaxID=74649 RepID=UPI001AD8B66B|nr:nifU-like protein 1, chloroplastic [Rosa chinensis]